MAAESWEPRKPIFSGSASPSNSVMSPFSTVSIKTAHSRRSVKASTIVEPPIGLTTSMARAM